MGPGQGGSQVGMGLGGRKYSREDIGPGPGRVPGLFRQKGEVFIVIILIQFSMYTYIYLRHVRYILMLIEFLCLCISGFYIHDIGKEMPYGGKWVQVRVGHIML